MLMAVSQIGRVPLHSALVRHGTHVPVAVSQTGVAPVHNVRLAAEQRPHAPDDWQTGFADGHSLSPAQARQVDVPVSQIGIAPPH
jgi:hypothetical protein